MMSAMGSMAAANGTRAWLGHRRPRWLTPKRLRSVTVALFSAALLASAFLMSGSTPAPSVPRPAQPLIGGR
ncbi:MAG: hypothetical protein QOJ29_1520 [Thermoleophilaceae bacterium]|nr:hypothetical protein [Thermoleophilaceae bacterium]